MRKSWGRYFFLSISATVMVFLICGCGKKDNDSGLELTILNDSSYIIDQAGSSCTNIVEGDEPSVAKPHVAFMRGKIIWKGEGRITLSSLKLKVQNDFFKTAFFSKDLDQDEIDNLFGLTRGSPCVGISATDLTTCAGKTQDGYADSSGDHIGARPLTIVMNTKCSLAYGGITPKDTTVAFEASAEVSLFGVTYKQDDTGKPVTAKTTVYIKNEPY